MKNFLIASLVGFAIVLMACQPMAAAKGKAKAELGDSALIGVWVVELIGERPVMDNSPARIQFVEDGTINGNASCNRFFGEYSLSKTTLAIAPLGTTRMMCLPSLMEQEQRLLEHLPQATQVVFEDGLLVLLDNDGKLLIKAAREES